MSRKWVEGRYLSAPQEQVRMFLRPPYRELRATCHAGIRTLQKRDGCFNLAKVISVAAE